MSDLCTICGTPKVDSIPKYHTPYTNSYEGYSIRPCSDPYWGSKVHVCWTCRCGYTWQTEPGRSATNNML